MNYLLVDGLVLNTPRLQVAGAGFDHTAANFCGSQLALKFTCQVIMGRR